MAPIGMQVVAMAAKRHAVPFVVLVGIYKLTPLFPHEPGLSFNELKSPSAVLPSEDEAILALGALRRSTSSCHGAESCGPPQLILPILMAQNLADTDDSSLDAERGDSAEKSRTGNILEPSYYQVYNPSFDYVAPSFISLFLTGECCERNLVHACLVVMYLLQVHSFS